MNNSTNPQELLLSNNSFLITETDAKGMIKFANDEFCKYSGYTMDEIIGKPHNIVRHRDMPHAAFKELWDTVKSGKKWRGFVKNASKDGRYYWVYATIFPFTSCDGSQGFLSCRRKASAEEALKYEEIYRKMRAEEK